MVRINDKMNVVVPSDNPRFGVKLTFDGTLCKIGISYKDWIYQSPTTLDETSDKADGPCPCRALYKYLNLTTFDSANNKDRMDVDSESETNSISDQDFIDRYIQNGAAFENEQGTVFSIKEVRRGRITASVDETVDGSNYKLFEECVFSGKQQLLQIAEWAKEALED
jgi:hypothetical protein